MSILGEVVLTASVELLLKKLTSSELLSFANQERIHSDLKKWEKTLRKMSAVLEDAEEKQTTSQSVNGWLSDLQNLAYDVEDLLDEFATVALERKLTHQPAEANTSKLRKLIPTFKPQYIKFNVKMRAEMKKITERFEEITAQRNNLDLREYSEAKSNKVRDQRRHTTSLPESHVYGREKDQEAIIELLLKDEGNEDGVSVIPIVGIGGLGKTTLAQNVYNDAEVKSHFEIKEWACVSDDFDVIRVTKTILQSILLSDKETIRSTNDLNQLQVELKKRLSKRKFLIVLDDVWNENYDEWTVLLCPFKAGSSGSKIIVTTRNDYISSMVGTLPTYRLKELSYDDCLSIFTHHSIGRKDFEAHQDLREIGEKIVRKCKGLPLAAKTLGGLLRGNVNRNDWECVLNNRIWNLSKERSDIMPALRLSYYYLPPHLKLCFAYCSLLPKDYEFQKEEIILLWMAQGFLQHESNEMQMEDLGDEYFRELQLRSFFQQSSNNTSRYVMHDLINDLAQWVAGETFFFRMENKVDGVKQIEISKNLRHLSYVGGMHDGIKKFEAFYDVNGFNNLSYNGGLRNKVEVVKAFSEFKHVRTFLPLMLSSYFRPMLTRDILNILPKLRRLRVLSLNRYYIDELSNANAIGDLKHLRYIDLSHTAICHLPESISSLYNLLTLKLEGCRNLKKLCDVGNLINLRYLNTSRTTLEEMPLNIGKLTNLRRLSDFVVSCSGLGLKALKLLKHLRGTLRISRLENINDVVDAKEADLSGKRDLRELLLEWSDSKFSNEEMETQVLDMLRPNQKLEQLTINGCRGISLPAWLGDTSFSNIVLLSIQDCWNCISLPSIGQLSSLKELVICRMNGIKRVGPELYGNGCSRPFPSLETLYFKEMEKWEEWISHGIDQLQVEVFPHLQQLSIVDCPKLKGRLPEHIPSLKSLVIQSCGELPVSVASLPVGCRFEIDGCKQVQPSTDIDLVSLNSMIFADFRGHAFLVKRFIQRLSEVEEVEIVGYKASSSLWHSGIISLQEALTLRYSLFNRLLYLLEEKEEELQLQGLPCIWQYLILDSVCLSKLPQVLLNLDFLRRISIANCSELVSFPEATLPSHLRSIDIDSCDALKCLPDTWMDCTSLECLSISCCGSLKYLTRRQLFPNLKKLVIWRCKDLKTLMQEEDNSLGGSSISATSSFSKSELPATLEHMEIELCNNLAYLLSGGYLPKALKYLGLHDCSKLESVAERFQDNTCLKEIHISYCENLQLLPEDVNKLDHLEWITINYCPSLLSFPRGGLPFMNLTNLEIDLCEKQVELPDNMYQLSNLQQIQISYCSSLVSIPTGGFSSTNLTELIISNCKKLEALPNDMYFKVFKDKILDCKKLKGLPNRMQNLTSLRDLRIWKCGGMESFPEDGFPINLTSLCIIDTPKICERLFQWGLHKLSSLRQLCMKGCPDVVSFPPQERGILLPTSLIILYIREFPDLKCLSSVIQSLNSLEELNLENCPKLKSFPEKGLPLSLLKLRSYGCPLLAQNCEKHKGRYWPMIAYIPEIDMDYSFSEVKRQEFIKVMCVVHLPWRLMNNSRATTIRRSRAT